MRAAAAAKPYATPEALGEYILVDYVASKTKKIK
jgi:hypothetical protein